MRVFTVMDYISNRTRLKAMSIIFRMKSIYYCAAVPYFLARPNVVFSQFEIAACLQRTLGDKISLSHVSHSLTQPFLFLGCRDRDKNCGWLSKVGYCHLYIAYMRKKCCLACRCM